MISKLRPNQYSRIFIALLVVIEMISLALSFNLTLWMRDEVVTYTKPAYQSFAFAWMLLWVVLSLLTDTYAVGIYRKIRKVFGATFKIALLHLPISALLAFFMGMDQLSFTFLADIYLLFITLSVGVKAASILCYRYLCNLEKNKNRAVILGYTPAGLNLHRYFTKSKVNGYKFVGFFDDNVKNPMILGDVDQMKKFCIRENVNEIFYALPYDSIAIQELSKFADENFIRFGILQDLGSQKVKSMQSDIYDNDLPVLSLKSSLDARESIKAGYQKALSVLRSLNL